MARKIIISLILFISLSFIAKSNDSTYILGVDPPQTQIKFDDPTYTTISYNPQQKKSKHTIVFFIILSVTAIILDLLFPQYISMAWSNLLFWQKLKLTLNELHKIKKIEFNLIWLFSLIPFIFFTASTVFLFEYLSKIWLAFIINFLFIILLNFFILSANLVIKKLFNLKYLTESINFLLKIFFIALYPILFLLSFLALYCPIDKPFIIIGWISIFITYLIRIIRLLQTFSEAKFPKFYLILYLCTAEILPVFLFLKFINF